GRPRRPQRGGADERRPHLARPRAGDGWRAGTGAGGAGGSDVSRWHQAGHGASAHSVITVEEERAMNPGEIDCARGEIELNAGRPTVTVAVANSGDRPIQVGSHYHFYETNPALQFERERARGFRLNIAAGTAVRFEPGQTRTVELVAYGGWRRVYGFRGAVMGSL